MERVKFVQLIFNMFFFFFKNNKENKGEKGRELVCS
jgi:hypothetical protein